MVEKLKDDLLLRRTRHTNLQVPHSGYVSYDTYPEQDTLLLGTTVIQKYRNLNIADLTEEELSKTDNKYDKNSREITKDNVYTDEFKILRFDIEEPYIMISISTDYRYMLVCNSRKYLETVCEYCIQLDEYIGLTVFNQYPGTLEERKGITLSVDNGEPCNAVIAEIMENNSIRFVLGDECQSILCGYWKDTGNYNTRFEIPNIGDYKCNDGNYPYYKNNTELEIINIRKNILKGALLYGIV